MRVQPEETIETPPISVLVPVKDVDFAFEKAQASLYQQDYSAFEILVCGDNPNSHIFTTARQLAEQFLQTETQFLVAGQNSVRNPKINNLIPGMETAKYATLLIKDSNIVLEPDDLTRMAERLETGIGLVSAIPVAIEPATFAAEIELSMMNGRDAPFVLAFASLGKTIGYGKVMLFRRSDFEQAGGIEMIADHFGDDHALAMGLKSIGLSTVYTDRAVRQPLGHRTFSAVWHRQLRWMVIRRNQEILAFLGEPFIGIPAAVLAAAFAAPALGLPIWGAMLATLILRIGGEMVFLKARGWPIPKRYPLAALTRDVMSLALWPLALRARRVTWVGDQHDLANRQSQVFRDDASCAKSSNMS